MEKLCGMLSHRKVNIRKEASWCISNLLADDANMVAIAMETPIFTRLFHILRTDILEVIEKLKSIY